MPFSIKDHSVSQETFQIVESEYDGILKTDPQPADEDLPNYYMSEDYISHTDSRRNLLEQVYHLVRKSALKRKLNLIESFKTDGKELLDIGCGTGDFLKVARENNWVVSGVEPDVNARKIANEKTGDSVQDISALLEFSDQGFDVITLWHVLEHLPKLEDHIQVFQKLLKPNGKLIIAVPNYKSYDALYYQNFWAAYDVPRHLWHFSQSGMSDLFNKFGFKLSARHPMKFDSFYVSLLSEKYKNGFMNPFMAFWVGLRSNLKAKSSMEYSSLIYCFEKLKTSNKSV